jgi:large subunit ribosomal protein L10
MSKYVKNLITEHLRERLSGVNDAVLVNVIGLSGNANHRLRTELQNKQIHLMVVKNSLAARATEGTPLSAMFEGLGGTAAICWGGEDIVTLAKEVTRLTRDEQFPALVPRGGVIDGQRISDVQVAEVSRWPSRLELLSIVSGQILSPAAILAGQLTSTAGALASQIEQRGKEETEEAEGTEPQPEQQPGAA